MDMLSRDDLQVLAEHQDGLCVSMFLPIEKAGKETRQNQIRFKNMLREAEASLAESGMRSSDARDFLEPAGALLDDGAFWQYQEDTLAIFRSSALFRVYSLPTQYQPLLVVTDRFHIKPLLSLFTANDQFFILALSQHVVRLLRGTRFSVEELELPKDMPTHIAEILGDEHTQRQIRLRSNIESNQGHQQTPVFKDNRINIARYFQEIDRGIYEILKGEDSPLVLAGVDYLLPIYREQNSYQHLVEEGVTGNPDLLKPEELHAQAWVCIEPHLKQAQQEAAEKYYNALATDRASNDIREVVAHAYYGRVDSLFVATSTQQWGSFDPITGDVELHMQPEAGDQDLLDLAAVQTILNSGTVYAVAPDEVPDQRAVAAVLRY